MSEPTEETTDPMLEHPDEVIEDMETPKETAGAVTGGGVNTLGGPDS